MSNAKENTTDKQITFVAIHLASSVAVTRIIDAIKHYAFLLSEGKDFEPNGEM
jgi:hypothetical protein